MVIPPHTLIDKRTPEEIIKQIKKLAESYLPNNWIAGDSYSVNSSEVDLQSRVHLINRYRSLS